MKPDPEWEPEEFVTDLRHELRTRGMPKMDLTVNFHDDGDLTVFIANCSMTGFTTESYYPDGQEYKPRRIAEDLVQTFLDFVEWDDQPNFDQGS